jgi:hypothetical protein
MGIAFFIVAKEVEMEIRARLMISNKLDIRRAV